LAFGAFLDIFIFIVFIILLEVFGGPGIYYFFILRMQSRFL
jgi:hypothetical protein